MRSGAKLNELRAAFICGDEQSGNTYWPNSRLSSQSKTDLPLAISHRPPSWTYSSWLFFDLARVYADSAGQLRLGLAPSLRVARVHEGELLAPLHALSDFFDYDPRCFHGPHLPPP